MVGTFIAKTQSCLPFSWSDETSVRHKETRSASQGSPKPRIFRFSGVLGQVVFTTRRNDGGFQPVKNANDHENVTIKQWKQNGF
jgi:hypothetical protein